MEVEHSERVKFILEPFLLKCTKNPETVGNFVAQDKNFFSVVWLFLFNKILKQTRTAAYAHVIVGTVNIFSSM